MADSSIPGKRQPGLRSKLLKISTVTVVTFVGAKVGIALIRLTGMHAPTSDVGHYTDVVLMLPTLDGRTPLSWLQAPPHPPQAGGALLTAEGLLTPQDAIQAAHIWGCHNTHTAARGTCLPTCPCSAACSLRVCRWLACPPCN